MEMYAGSLKVLRESPIMGTRWVRKPAKYVLGRVGKGNWHRRPDGGVVIVNGIRPRHIREREYL